MSQDPTRKEFFAKLLGVIAAASFLPKLFAKSAPAPAPSAAASVAKTPGIQLRAAPRTVARRADSL